MKKFLAVLKGMFAGLVTSAFFIYVFMFKAHAAEATIPKIGGLTDFFNNPPAMIAVAVGFIYELW